MAHYLRARTWGDPLHERWPTWQERFDARVQIGAENECWPWTGAISATTGYGQFWKDGKNVTAHSVAYVRDHGPVPEGMEIDHTCFNRACVNQAHLEAVTRKVNMRRMMARRMAAKAAAAA